MENAYLKPFSKRQTFAFAAIVIAVLIFFGYQVAEVFHDPSWTKVKIEESKKIGDTIVDGLMKFRVDHNTFPKTLQELVPNYISQIETPTAGCKEWEYYCSGNGQDFYLGFRAVVLQNQIRLFDTRRGNQWIDDD